MQYEIEKKCETRLNFNVNLSQFSMSFRIEKQSQIAVDMYQSLRLFDIFFQRKMTFFCIFSAFKVDTILLRVLMKIHIVFQCKLR